jgi:pimeloyl-ACP methyl ester carboxylesterase
MLGYSNLLGMWVIPSNLSDPFFFEAAGHRLRTQWIGAPEAATHGAVVFLHEGLGSIPQWKGFPEAVCRATGRRGLVYERWGFGGSERLVLPRPRDYLNIEAETVLPEVLDVCGIARPILIGHSDGASIALLFAAAFPERAAGCVSMAAHAFVEDITLAGIRGVVARWESGDIRGYLERYHGDNTDTAFLGWAETWLRPDFRDWAMVDCLPRVTCPVLVMQGEDDEYGSAAQVEAIAAGVSGRAEAVLLPGCGHSPHLQARETVLSRITAFLADLPA